MNRLFNSKLWRGLDFLADIFLINTLWLICCLPVVTIGAATAAMNHCYFRIFTNRREKIFKLFFDGFKQNFRQASIVWLVYLMVFIDIAIVIYTAHNGILPSILFSAPVICLAALLGLTLLFVLNYIFAVIAYYDCSLMQCVINSLGFAFRFPIQTLLMLIMSAALIVFIYIAPFLLLVAFSGCCAFQCKAMLVLFSKAEALTAPSE